MNICIYINNNYGNWSENPCEKMIHISLNSIRNIDISREYRIFWSDGVEKETAIKRNVCHGKYPSPASKLIELLTLDALLARLLILFVSPPNIAAISALFLIDKASWCVPDLLEQWERHFLSLSAPPTYTKRPWVSLALTTNTFSLSEDCWDFLPGLKRS